MLYWFAVEALVKEVEKMEKIKVQQPTKKEQRVTVSMAEKPSENKLLNKATIKKTYPVLWVDKLQK